MMSSLASEALIQISPVSSPIHQNFQATVTVSFRALGCRLNQSEAGSLEGGFAAEGFRVVGDDGPAEICVINTCSVTQQAEAKCRSLIRGVLRRHPETFIAVTGCYAQIGVEALKQMGGIDLIAGSDQKMALPTLVQKVLKGGLQKRATPLIFHSERIRRADFTIPAMSVFEHTTRPNIKIQDGCDFFCSFCIIPTTRGRSRSRVFEDVLLEAGIWAERGHREIVLTGVNLGEYYSEGQDLLDLIQALEDIEGLARIRISSIEPTTISSRLIAHMADSKKLCAYLHLPLQSGSDAVLLEMGRRYRRQDYIDFVQEAIACVPNLGLGTDVMVGFPGENEADFDATLSLLKSLPFSYLHVFPYSRRKGTRVMRKALPPVHPAVIKARSKQLCALSQKMRSDFDQKAIGEKVAVLFETRNKAGLFCGLTENYIRVGVETEQDLSGCLKRVQIDGFQDKIARGRLIA